MSDKGDRNGEGSHKRSKSSLALSLLHRERSREDRDDKLTPIMSSQSVIATPPAPEKSASIEQSVRTFRLFESLRSGDTAAILRAMKEASGTGTGSSSPAIALEGTTLLHLAIRCAELPVLEYILSVATTTPGMSIDINARDKDGNTPLHLAAQLGRSPIVHLLLEQEGVNDSIANYQGRSPIDLARNPDIFQQLQLSRSIFLDQKVRDVHDLIGRADHAGLEKLLEDPRVQNVLDVNGGELVTDPITSQSAGTLLHEAARKKDTRLIQILLLHGADPFRRDRKGKLPQDVTKDERTRGVLKRSPAAAAAQRGIQERAVLGSSAGIASATLSGASGEAALTSKEGREMKGYLKKWTNYTSGYKLRWFVLEDGVLSYYKNQDDAGSACRGAIHMRIAKLHMDPQDKQRFEIHGKSSVKYHLKANHVVEAKRWYWALNNAIQWSKDESREEERQKIKNTEQLQQAKIDQAERASQRDKSDSAGESASITSARQGNRNSKVPAPGNNLGPIASRMAAAGTSTGPASIAEEDNGTAYDSYEPSVHRVVSNIGTTTGDVDRDEEYGDDVSSHDVQPVSKDAFNITAQSAKLQLDLLADISTALNAERNRNPSMTISNTVVVSALRSYESAVDSLKGLVGDLLKISRDRDAYWQYRLDREADVRRLWEDSMARVVKEQEALEGKIGESEDKRKRTKRALRDVLESGGGVTFESQPASRDAVDHEVVSEALENVNLNRSAAALSPDFSGLSRRKSRVEEIIGISDSEDEGDEEFFDAIDAGEVEVVSEIPTSPPPEIIKEAKPALDIREAKKAEIEPSFAGYEDGPRERLKMDADNRPKISLWGILKSMIGKDMTKMTLPVSFNEPTSLLQRVAEDMEYTDLLDIAADRPDPTERMVYVAAFAASEYSSTTGRVAKPFNPLLGETYEYARSDKGYRFFIEQVSHHPPIGAAWAESPRWDYYGESAVKSKFYGKSFDINPLGTWFLKLRPITGGEELYTWKKVTSSVVGIITGAPTVDNYGPMEVKNWTTGEVCNLDFKQRGWRAAGAYEVKGRVLDSNGSQRWSIGGHWNDKIYARLTPGYDDPVTAPDNSSIRSGGSGGANRAFLVWQSHPRPSGIPFNLTPFVVTLNAIPDSLHKVVCPTDTRLRPDQRAMEDGEYDLAATEKNRLEEKQRATRREREARGEEFVPKWFKKGVCEVTGEEYWVFNGEYWKMRKRVAEGGVWEEIEDIF
ncbi:MAG: hypothetical protein M1839_004216 [Geoglossum umbratile]|nr:MAG: hypothetical protein M1839_004216 [Geoglossum umbratile]